MIDHIWRILIIWTFVMSLAFCGYYQFAAKWWLNEFGRSLMIYQLSMTLLLGFTVINMIFGEMPIPVQVAGIVTLAVVPFALTWRLIVLIKVQREVRRGDSGDHKAE
jgi:hypothetical protein